MESVKPIGVNTVAFAGNKNANNAKNIAPEEKKNGKKLLAIGAAVLAAAGVATILICKGKGTKGANKLAQSANTNKGTDAVAQNANTMLSELKFNRGTATKGNELFTGTAEHVNKNGDKFILVYKDGKIVSSAKNINPKSGAGDLEKGNFFKSYSQDGDTRCVTKRVDTINGRELSKCESTKNEVIITNAKGETKHTHFYEENGQRWTQQELFDGTERTFNENGRITDEHFPDGGYRLFDDYGNPLTIEGPVAIDGQDTKNVCVAFNPEGKIERIDDGYTDIVSNGTLVDSDYKKRACDILEAFNIDSSLLQGL